MEEEKIEQSIRPSLIEEYIGQSEVKENMKVFIEAAKIRGESLDSCAFRWYLPADQEKLLWLIL